MMNFFQMESEKRSVEVLLSKITKSHALGRPFHLGDLYDYRNDRILTGTTNHMFSFGIDIILMNCYFINFRTAALVGTQQFKTCHTS